MSHYSHSTEGESAGAWDTTPFATDNLYHLLEVPYTADRRTITAAYRQIMKKWHPDRVPDYQRAHAEDLAKRVNHAYATLSDPIKRARYDTTIRTEALQAQIMNKYVGGLGGQMYGAPPPGAQAPKRQMTERERRERRASDRQATISVLIFFTFLTVCVMVVVVIWALVGALAAAIL